VVSKQNETVWVGEEEWLQILLDKRSLLSFPMHGHLLVAKDWCTHLRTLPVHVIYLITQRAMTGEIQGKAVRFERGSLIWMSPGIEHDFWIPKGELPFTNYYVRLNLTYKEKSIALKNKVIIQRDALILEPLLRKFREEIQTHSLYEEYQLRSLWSQISAETFRMSFPVEEKELAFNHEQKLKLMRYQQEHVTQKPRPSDLAKVLRLSPDYFSRVFKRTFKTSPRQWLLRERMRLAAARLTESNLNITELSQQFGYENVYMFSRQFKQILGQSPRKYRKQR
jgi:AraC-like DNA-binding protein